MYMYIIFQRAKELGIHITAHAGEAGSAASVKEVNVFTSVFLYLKKHVFIYYKK